MKKDYEFCKQIQDNIKLLCKRERKKIGDLEKYVGCSQGYFTLSRVNINAKTLYLVSKFLGVSMDDIVTKNYKKEMLKERIKELQEELERME